MRPADFEDQDYFRRFRSVNTLHAMNMPNKIGPTSQSHQRRVIVVREQDTPSHYQDVVDSASHKFPSESRMQRILEVIKKMPAGYRTTIDLSGVPLGYLCTRLTQSDRHPYVLHGLYITGVVRNFYTHMVENDPAFQDTPGGLKTVYRSVDQLHIKEFPLWKVDPFSPQDPDIFYNANSFEHYLEECIASKGGSDMNTYFLWSDCSITRRARTPAYVERNVFVTRTAGLSHIITKSYEKEFEFQDIRYTLYIPDGLENCFTSAVKYGYLKRYEQLFPPSNQEEMMVPMSLSSDNEMMTPYTMKKEFIEKVLDEIELERIGNGNSDTRNQNRRKRILQHGFSMHEMNQRATMLVNKASIVPYVYRINGKPDFPYLKNYCSAANAMNASFLADDLYDYVSVLLMTDTGHILDPLKHKQYLTGNESSSSGLLHAISIFPPITHTTIQSSGYDEQKHFVECVEKITTEFMNDMYTESRYCTGGECYDVSEVEKSIERVVQVQRDRHEHRMTDTLIFHSKKEKKKGSFQKQLRTYHREQANVSSTSPKNPPLVVAYDIETVAYDITTQHEMDQRVWKPFHKDPNVLESGDYAPLDSQIPYSVQWVPVNLTENVSSSRYAQKKIQNTIHPRRERATSHTLLSNPDMLILLSDKVTRPVDVILQPPETCYGQDRLLGQCVHQFLHNVACFALENKYSQVYCYAHNGVSFDAYIILQYCLHPVKKILKTSRGILSMSIEVPVNEQTKVTVHFRDTRVHIAGSLKAICKSFKVPPEWCKLDFPIMLVTSKNCHHPEVISVTKPYGENDVLCLAYIIKKLNESIMDSEWEPADICSDRPPIVQFLTCMSMVKASTLNHFRKDTGGNDSLINCHAIDLPSIRHWIQEATMGGRANAYARSYASPMWSRIYDAYMKDDTEGLKILYQQITQEHKCKRVLDVTSLYPFAQSHSPLPLGELFFLKKDECERLVQNVYCEECEKRKTLCPFHRDTSRTNTDPFAIILVHNISIAKGGSFRNMCGRKLFHTGGLFYTQENPQEVMERLGQKEQRSIQAYTHIDLYWMSKQGFHFECICGVAWDTAFTYSDFIIPAFQKRIVAKKEGNKVVSEMLKLLYNSAYGVTTQRDISDGYFLATLPPHLRERTTADPELIQYLLDKCDRQIGPDEELDEAITFANGQTYIKKKKKAHISEFYGEQSPMHIGSAILANARHIMNLLMFSEPATLMTYTDTDSICIADHIAHSLGSDVLNDREDAFMGTYKNDHNEGPRGENNQDARVVLSLIGTKKVKMHVTLNPKGEIKIFNTFKGLNPANHLPGRKEPMHPDFTDKIVTDTLIHIGLTGSAPNVQVTHWKRDMTFGVSIGDHPQQSTPKTYLDHSIGTRFALTPSGVTEMFIPFGYPPELLQSDDCLPSKNLHEQIYRDDPNRLKHLSFAWGFSNEMDIVLDMLQFSEKYYSHSNEVDVLDTDEYREYWEIFQKVNREINDNE